MTEWREVRLGEVCELKRGYDLPKTNREAGRVPIVSSSGPSGFHSQAKVQAPGVVTGRYGTLGQVFYLVEDFWPLNTALYVRDFKGNEPRFVAALLESMELAQHDGAAAVPGLNRNQLHELPVLLPDRRSQKLIACILAALNDLIENNRRRVVALDEMAQAIYGEWFVRFRYPGHEQRTLVDSILGPIPEGWDVRSVADVASQDRYAVTGGPFGSKLGRKDYIEQGVPVLRGANLRLGGGFDESNLVFVSDLKAEELRSSIARRGDVVVTQRGTLGQVGLVPAKSQFERYVLSQSQMKVTVDPNRMTTQFLYAQMRSEATAGRFIAQAMTAGVPHVNLALLRAFEILVPPSCLQVRFSDAADALLTEAHHLKGQTGSLAAIRDLLLPKLVTGQIDVSSLDLDALAEAGAA